MSDVKLTPGQEWFKGQQPVWERVVTPFFSQHKTCRALEIGSWEGGSAVWILSNLCGGDSPDNQLVCIDHFDLLETQWGRERLKTFQGNIAATGLGDRVRVMREFSTPALMRLMEEIAGRNAPGFDFVYIDGAHRADDTLLDAEMAWRMTKRGALLIFDDYHWSMAEEGTIHHPKDGIDAFLAVHHGEYDVIHHGYQVMIKKLVEQRLGFSPDAKSAG